MKAAGLFVLVVGLAFLAAFVATEKADIGDIQQELTKDIKEDEDATKLERFTRGSKALKKVVDSNTEALSNLRKQVENNTKRIEKLEKERGVSRKGPIFQIVGPSGTYTLTYGGGVQACLDQGTTIASEEAVQEAQEQGLDHCACGWVSNQKSVYPTQTARPGCGNKVGVVTCTWRNKWNVWCKTKVF